MNEIIKIEQKRIGENEINSVDARELHAFLESGRQFGNWITERIKQYDFTEGVDFIKFNDFVKSDSRARTEYIVSIDMAKELSMVERNEKGKEARKYFIECEKALKSISAPKTEAEKLLEAFSILTAQVEHEKTLRLEAERTKAMIGDKKVATALVTASHAVRKANKLEKENDTLREMVGDSKDFKQVKALPWLKTYFDLSKKAAYSQVGKALSAISRENGYEIREIENSEYPHPIKAYSVKAIEAFLYKIHADESYLKNYRIL